MLRNLRWIQRDPLTFLRHLASEHGDLVSFPMPRTPALFVNHPDGVRRVLQANHQAYGRGTVQYRTLSYVTGGGLLTADGERWMRHRRLMQPAFHRAAITSVVEHTGTAIDRRLHEWEAVPDGTVVDVDDAMMRTALEVVGASLFSTDLSGEADRLVRAVLAALDEVIVRARNPLTPPPRFPTPGNLRLRRALRTLDYSVARMVGERRALERDADTGPTPDLLGLLLAAHDDVDEPFSNAELRDEIVTTIVAGHETVASALTWTWHLLSGAPEVEARLHAEVDSVLGGRAPTLEDVGSLPYTRAVLDEALRLYPPAWLISRRADQPDELLGHAVAEGSLVFLSPWVLHRHPDVWERPDEFDPERFLAPQKVDRFAYVPFGTGPNLCIGRDFALLEGVLVVAALASRYRFEAVPGHVVKPEPLVTIRPKDGLPVRLRRR
jgi:cytochrome P450